MKYVSIADKNQWSDTIFDNIHLNQSMKYVSIADKNNA